MSLRKATGLRCPNFLLSRSHGKSQLHVHSHTFTFTSYILHICTSDITGHTGFSPRFAVVVAVGSRCKVGSAHGCFSSPRVSLRCIFAHVPAGTDRAKSPYLAGRIRRALLYTYRAIPKRRLHLLRLTCATGVLPTPPPRHMGVGIWTVAPRAGCSH